MVTDRQLQGKRAELFVFGELLKRGVISSYEQFQDLLSQPEDLEDVLTMYEALQSPKEQMLTLDEYEQRRNSAS
jgi:hypothetical protein